MLLPHENTIQKWSLLQKKTERINNIVGEQTTLMKEELSVTNESIQQLKRHIFELEEKTNLTSYRQLYVSEILTNYLSQSDSESENSE